MTTTQRSRVTLAGACALTALALAVPLPAAAAPYTPDPVIEVPTTNPAVGGQLTLTVHGFTTGQTVVFELHSTVYYLGSAVVDANGDASLVAQLPAGVTCQHYITATSPSHLARTDIVIGPPEACTSGGGNSGHGNSGNGNSGSGNTGNGNSGFGNTGNGNSGFNNTGNGNSGFGNSGNGNSGSGNTGNGNSGYGGDPSWYGRTPYGDDDWGTVSYARSVTSAPQDHVSDLALISLTGLTLVAGAGFLRRRRRMI